MSIHRPRWFSDDYIMVSTAATCGLSRGGRILRKVDSSTAQRVQVVDAETGEFVDQIDDQLLDDMQALTALSGPAAANAGSVSSTLSFVPAEQVDLRLAVPAYYDRRYQARFAETMRQPEFEGFTSTTIGELARSGHIIIRPGHGSPSQEQRIGEVPYIKVSDLRAGLVNINPTNRVPKAIAEGLWRAHSSGLAAFDLVSPERTSKNIGDFCLLMPGQEQVLLTKEIIVIRPGPDAPFDAFYLLWALTLKVVRDQWRRVVFMQTNREDVGKRYYEIELPMPPDAAKAAQVSEAFRAYYQTIATARQRLQTYLAADDRHHFFVSGAERESPATSVEDESPSANPEINDDRGDAR